MKEIYKSITGYKNYAVSNRGNVKNVKTGRVLKQSTDTNGYLAVSLYFDGRKKTFQIHKLVALAFLEKVEGKSVVDHKDSDKLNNKVSNLRFCTTSQNNMNRKKKSKTSTSQYKGVSFAKNCKKWRAQIRVDGKKQHIGLFTTEIEGAKAYDKKAKQIFGEFAKLNFPDEDD